MNDRVRFVHAADLHLGAPFQGISAVDRRIGGELASATFVAFANVVDTCIEREVDFLLLGGDVYNAREHDPRAQRVFLEGVQRLADAGVRTYSVCGNHDPASGWAGGWKLPEAFHVFAHDRVERVEFVRDGAVACALYGRSFATSRVTESLVTGFRRHEGDGIAIGVLHTNVGSNAEYENYAPSTVSDLRAADMDYWALGHIHKYQVLAEDPHVVYPGSPQGLNPKETGAHGCCVVELSPGGMRSFEHVDTAPIAWMQHRVDLSDADGIDDVRDRLAQVAEDLRPANGGSVVVRLELVGRTTVHAELTRPGTLDAIAEELQANHACGSPWVWVERLCDNTRSMIDLDALRAGDGFAADVLGIADAISRATGEAGSLIEDVRSPVAAKVRGMVLDLDPEAVLARARDLVLDELLHDGIER